MISLVLQSEMFGVLACLAALLAGPESIAQSGLGERLRDLLAAFGEVSPTLEV
jgi:hypothetical protein